MKVIVTRPIEDAEMTADAVKARGHAPLLAPLMTIKMDEDVRFDGVDIQGLLITSANGIRAFAGHDPRRDLSVYTVGAASAEVSRALGFSDVKAAGGDVRSLIKLITERVAPKKGVLLHVAGSVVAGDLQKSLSKQGYEVSRVKAYEAQPPTELPSEIAEVMRATSQEKTAILFYSPRTLRIFSQLVERASLQAGCRNLVACCLSKSVSAELRDLPFAATKTPLRNTQSALLDLLELE
jgi:uroporphyrinogen-III synthase